MSDNSGDSLADMNRFCSCLFLFFVIFLFCVLWDHSIIVCFWDGPLFSVYSTIHRHSVTISDMRSDQILV